VKYSYHNNHSVIFGKIHTPVNYWNDSYHHGRVFYPIISRPLSFSHFVPLHTIGMQVQGQNIGKWNFGYDVVIGNGISSTDIFDSNSSPGMSAAIHFKPIEGMRIGASYYFNHMDQNGYGSHSGHTMPTVSNYRGPMDFHLNSLSIAYFGDKLSPLSDTTNLAPAMSGTDLFTHIRYMTLTTVPTLVLSLVLFVFLELPLSIPSLVLALDRAFSIRVMFLV
jgi:hypothetical protein